MFSSYKKLIPNISLILMCSTAFMSIQTIMAVEVAHPLMVNEGMADKVDFHNEEAAGFLQNHKRRKVKSLPKNKIGLFRKSILNSVN